MREVAVSVLDVFFQDAKKRGFRPERLVEGLTVDLAHLRSKHERISWADYCRMMENVHALWTDEEIIRLGGFFIDAPFVRHVRLLFGAALTPRDFYKWLAGSEQKSGGKQVFSNIKTTFVDGGQDDLFLDVRLDPGYAPCRTFFLLSGGGFAALPLLTGKEPAKVTQTEIERGVRFHVELPKGSGRQTTIRRAFNWLSSPLAAAREMDDAHTELQKRYEELELARQDLEKRVIERTAELQATTEKLAGTVRDLEEAKEVRDRIFANVNHDLRSPLSLVLLTVSELRAHGDLSTATERSVAAIEHGARRVLRMVDELLILAEGREGEVRLWMASVDLGAMVTAVGNAWMPAAHAAGLTLEHRAVENVSVRADANALERILANLVSNAIKFTPQGGTIRVSLENDDDHAVLRVADDGPGIDADLKTRLFGRFERGAKSATASGSGLGLSLVKELSEAHGGSVSVADADGGGTVFEVRLPRLSTRPSMAPRAASFEVAPVLRPQDYGIVTTTDAQTVQTYEPPAGVTPRATLLLAEDDPDLRERTAKLLSDTYRVIAAPNGAIALDVAMKQTPDVLITDIAMPEMDGIELTRRFRALPNNRLSPVLVLTTFGAARDKLEGFDAGAVDYIQKPFEPLELRARIRSQLTVRSLALQLLETEKLAALGTLSAGLAHEIRNPANGIINAVAPLREVLPPEALEPGSPAAQLLDIVEHCSKQVAAMSRQLLGFKRNVEPKRQPVPLDKLIARVCSTARPSLEGVQLRETIDYKGPIHCAEPLLAQVITNLLQNGAHAAGRGGWVEVRTALDEQKVVVEVTDSGPGVPDELKERIFEPFFTTKPAGSGTGLGLSTARDIVLRHGGTLDVRQASGRSVFRLEIPLIS